MSILRPGTPEAVGLPASPYSLQPTLQPQCRVELIIDPSPPEIVAAVEEILDQELSGTLLEVIQMLINQHGWDIPH